MEHYLAQTCALGGVSGFEAPDPILTCVEEESVASIGIIYGK